MGRGSRKRKKEARRQGTHDGPPMAEKADRHLLYEQSVQSPDTEVEFLAETFEAIRGREPLSLREDFAGTMALACEWLLTGEKRTAVAVDLDEEVLGWGERRHVARLTPGQRERLKIIHGDVLENPSSDLDMLVAFNFSYWGFKTRELLLRYFRHVRQQLADDGIFLLDCFGGYEAQREMTEDREIDGFTYIWDQAEFDPISHDYVCHIHFRFPDGSRMEEAFTYEWRLWSLPEIRELLEEAGFSRNTVYWQGWDDEDEEEDGEFEPVERGEADAGWVCYIVAEK